MCLLCPILLSELLSKTFGGPGLESQAQQAVTVIPQRPEKELQSEHSSLACKVSIINIYVVTAVLTL